MSLLTKEVKVGLCGKNKKYYMEKGYIIPNVINKNTKINVNVNDLPNGSGIKVECKCDNCNRVSTMQWCRYKNIVRNDVETYCIHCAPKLYGIENKRLIQLKNTVSFEKWCTDNNRVDILERWDYKLNKYKPYEISYKSNIKQWLKCPQGLHNSELNTLYSLTCNNTNIDCIACNSFGQWLIDSYGENALELYWCNKNTINPFTISQNSGKNIWLKCKNCGTEKLITPHRFVKQGFSCPKCSDGISFGEKIIYSILEQLSKSFQIHVGKTTYKWCKGDAYDYQYDFKIKEYDDIIIEVHGRQHYEDISFRCKKDVRSLEEEQENDRLKENLAKQNGIKHYIVLDCRKSELEWIKKSIMKSELPTLLNFKENDINWDVCCKNAYSSLMKEACSLYNSGMTNIKLIADQLKLNVNTIRRYLKSGAIINLCDYNAEESKILNYRNNSKRIYCVELNKTFSSISEAYNFTKVKNNNIIHCLKLRTKTAGGYHWMYYDDYLKLQ